MSVKHKLCRGFPCLYSLVFYVPRTVPSDIAQAIAFARSAAGTRVRLAVTVEAVKRYYDEVIIPGFHGRPGSIFLRLAGNHCWPFTITRSFNFN